MSSGKYEQLLPDGSRDAESDIGVESSVQQEDRSQASNNPALPWMISTLVCLGICVILTVQLRKVGESGFGTYESAFFTDINLPSTVPLETRRFTGTPKFEPNGSVYRTFNPEAPWPENLRYVGKPSQAIDDAWADLIECRYVSLTEDEAKRAWGQDYTKYRDEGLGGYTAGLDVFHTLHCVNALRMSLYPEYYSETRLHGTTHLEHCIDVLRQEVQCYGSTTLIPSQYFPAIEQNYIDSDQEHVCRSFTLLREWTDRRRIGGDLHMDRDHSHIDANVYDQAVKFNLDRNAKLCS